MYIRRLLLVFCVVLFGAYCEHHATKIVKKKQEEEKKLKQYKKEIRTEDAHFIKHEIDLGGVAVDRHESLGSIIVKDRGIIGEGYNKTAILNNASAHAEVDAIRNACQTISSNNLHGCSIYISSQPCPMCLSLIYLTGTKKIFHAVSSQTIDSLITIDAGRIYCELTKSQGKRAIPEIPVILGNYEKSMLRNY